MLPMRCGLIPRPHPSSRAEFQKMSTEVEQHRSRRAHSTDKSLRATKDVRTPSPRRGAGRRGSVTFDHQTSIYPDKGEGQEEQGLLKGSDEETEQKSDRGSCYGCHFLVENKVARRIFRVCAVINLISLAFSAPLYDCSPDNESDCDRVFVQLIIITVLDFFLALLYTIQTYVRFQYSLYQHWRRRQVCSFIKTIVCLLGVTIRYWTHL